MQQTEAHMPRARAHRLGRAQSTALWPFQSQGCAQKLTLYLDICQPCDIKSTAQGVRPRLIHMLAMGPCASHPLS